MAEKLPMMIDCDPGVDDAIAIMMALSQPSVDLLAITCVAGNTHLDNVLRNALRVLRVCDRLDVPVYKGADVPLLNLHNKRAHDVHGSDGLGGVPDPDPPSLDLVQSEHAVHAMLRLTKEHPGQVTMLAIGPLTNLALAIRLDPGFTGRLKKLVIMGGNTEGSGSETDAAEFNFHVDPEAAHILLSDVQCPTVIVAWETCLQNGLPWDWFEVWSSTPTAKAKFVSAILHGRFLTYLKSHEKVFRVCDGLAMAVALRPEMILKALTCPVMVELQGRVTRGQMVRRVKNTEGLPLGPEVKVVIRCDTDILRKLMEDTVVE
ncbi:inosine-uridine preferring nucleoside hydrolase-like [Acanthaster planci]|uniref:Inosine-uridine preferring nucleoside hydrolase-like n=1 Tax=Acanthaster planci TaxID=133434 RepID=A0A8B7YQC3_ACAPL|nr:inosine-uridine preferring nucleoside hydrolase-like [Acanthaster planci]XP_022094660.1 inosine-uridine preferring nucleoside hydrolase-like [Acanthaster planci]XP_022094661.1 inosine-uridine preferring nucleoside hydrolase-like [Acanthaster planci]